MRTFTREICSVELIKLSFLGSIVVVVVSFFQSRKSKEGRNESIAYVTVV